MTSVPTPSDRIDIDLFVIGAMKAATTGMCDWLAAQPGVAMSEPKEPSIFVSDDDVRRWAPRLDDLFTSGAPGDLRVEGSTDYTKFPAVGGVPQRVARHAPNARFVYLMRHPVARAISQYRFDWLLGGPSVTFERALQSNPQLVDNGRYGLQLGEWLDHFPADRFLLVFAEAFTADPAGQVRRVLDFAGLGGTADVVAPGAARTNDSDLLVRRTLTRKILRDSRFGRALRPLAPSWAAERYRARLRRRSSPVLSDEVSEQLERVFDADLARLADLTMGPALTCATWDDVAATWSPALV